MKRRGLAKRLHWLLSFANLDIPKLSHQRFRDELALFLEYFGKGASTEGNDEASRSSLMAVQATVREVLSKLTDPNADWVITFDADSRVLRRGDRAQIDTKRRDWAFTFERSPGNYLVNTDMWSTIGPFLLPILQNIPLSRVLCCSECGSYEFTNGNKRESQCRRCLTRERVRKLREKERKRKAKGRQTRRKRKAGTAVGNRGKPAADSTER